MHRRLLGRRRKSLENSFPDLGSSPTLYVPIPSEKGKKVFRQFNNLELLDFMFYKKCLQSSQLCAVHVCTFSVRSTVAGETVLRLELCCRVSRRGRGNECGRAT